MMSRYSRQVHLPQVGLLGQQKLQNARILVIGAGGLACAVLPYLTTGGIGTIGIIDGDKIDESNLQRQVLYPENAVGESKVLQAKKKLEALNSATNIKVYNCFLNAENAVSIIENYDVVVDATDSLAIRYLINDACIIAGKPFVYGSVYRFEGQVSVFNYKNGPSYRCLFPNPPKKGDVPNCEDIGVLGVLPGIIGTMQANEVLKIILEIGNVLSGKLLFYNALSFQSTILNIQKSENEINQVLKNKDAFEKTIVTEICDIESFEVSIENIYQKENIQFIDVRETHELPKVEDLQITSIPLSVLENQLNKIHPEKEKAIFCQSGIRSKKAVSILESLNINNCISMIEGASDINNYLKQHKIVSNDK